MQDYWEPYRRDSNSQDISCKLIKVETDGSYKVFFKVIDLRNKK